MGCIAPASFAHTHIQAPLSHRSGERGWGEGFQHRSIAKMPTRPYMCALRCVFFGTCPFGNIACDKNGSLVCPCRKGRILMSSKPLRHAVRGESPFLDGIYGTSSGSSRGRHWSRTRHRAPLATMDFWGVDMTLSSASRESDRRGEVRRLAHKDALRPKQRHDSELSQR